MAKKKTTKTAQPAYNLGYTTVGGTKINTPKDFGLPVSPKYVAVGGTNIPINKQSGLTGPTGPIGSAGSTGPTGPIDAEKEKDIFTATDGTKFTDKQSFDNYQEYLNDKKSAKEETEKDSRSAYNFILEQFSNIGLSELVEPLKGLIKDGLDASEFKIKLRETDAYKKRFAGNAERKKAGLSELSPAEYVALEDQYQNIMRRYGLPSTFYAKDNQGRQANLEQFIAGDVSPAELEDRVQLAVDRVEKAAPEVLNALETYYGGPNGISKSNLVGYILNPQLALPEIQRKVRAAEIGGAAKIAGFGLGAIRAEELAARGITQQQAQQGYQTAAQIIPRAEELASIYGAEKYDQTAAEQEIFGLEGAASARRKRQKLGAMEQAQFGAQTGLAGSALERGRSGAF